MNFWKVLHPLLSREENNHTRTGNGAILHAIANSLTGAEDKVIADRPLESLATSTGVYLDYWGNWWGLPRKDNESDDHYRKRMECYLLLPRGTKQSIINAIKYHVHDKNCYVDVYEPWQNVFILDKSKLDGVDHLQGSYYRYGVIDVSMDRPITDDILKVIDDFKPVGVKVYTNYNPLMSEDSKVTYLGKQSALITDDIDLEYGTDLDTASILLGLDDYDYNIAKIANESLFKLDSSKLDSDDLLANPASISYAADNMLLGTSDKEQKRKNTYSQIVDAKPSLNYSFCGYINPDIRARISLNFLNDANFPLSTISSKEIHHNSGMLRDGFTRVELSGKAPDKTSSVEIAIDNRTSITDNQVKKSHTTFHNDGTDGCPVSFDLANDLGGQTVTTRVEFTVSNLKNEGYLSIVDGADTDDWNNLVPMSEESKPPQQSDIPRFILDNSKLDSNDELAKANLNIKPVPPITENGTYTYELTTTKHSLKQGATKNRIAVKTNLDADIDIKVKLAVYNSSEMDMNWSVYKDEDGYYNDYLIREFKLVSGDNPNLHWTLAPTEVDKPSPYYVDIVKNTNVKLSEVELRNTKKYNKQGAKISFAKLHNRNIALKTGLPVSKQNVDKIDKLYDLSIPIVAGKTYTVLMNYASDDVNTDKKIVITAGDSSEEILNTELSTKGDIKTYHGTYTAKSDISGQYLNLRIENGTASDLYILNFKLGVD